MELDESITLIWLLPLCVCVCVCVCVWQKNLFAFCGKRLVELAGFSMIHLLFFVSN